MNLFLDALGWLFTPENWGGASGISSRLQQHLYFTLAVVAVACVLAFPAGVAIGHTRRGVAVVPMVTASARALPTLGLLTLVGLWSGLGLVAPFCALLVLAIPPMLAGAYSGITSAEPVTVDEGEWDPSAQTVAVLVAGPQTDPRMFTDFVAKLRTPIARAAIIEAFDPNRPGDPTATIDAREGTRLATRIAAEVTGLAGGPGSEILLCHALSFPLAVLLGRLLNKYRIVCYEAIGKQWYQRLCALSQSDAQIDCVYDDP